MRISGAVETEKLRFSVSSERYGSLVRCETCDQTIAFVAKPVDVKAAIDEHEKEAHPAVSSAKTSLDELVEAIRVVAYDKKYGSGRDWVMAVRAMFYVTCAGCGLSPDQDHSDIKHDDGTTDYQPLVIFRSAQPAAVAR